MSAPLSHRNRTTFTLLQLAALRIAKYKGWTIYCLTEKWWPDAVQYAVLSGGVTLGEGSYATIFTVMITFSKSNN